MNIILKIARKIKNVTVLYSCVIGSFLLGRCSFTKMCAFLHEHPRLKYRNLRRKFGKPIKVTHYNGKKLLTRDEANIFIGNAIERGEPFMSGRFGSGEINAVWRVRDDGKGFIAPIEQAFKALTNNAGFFPEDKQLIIKFAELMKWSTSQVNLMAIWFNSMEEYTLRTYGKNPEYTNLHDIDPFFADSPWSAKLEGKNVVVIHPFAKSIIAQYSKRELLFPGKNVLPEFNLRVVKAVQTIAGTKDSRFNNWFEALDYMYNEAMSKDFDVAIIGCGAYGFPLAAKIKAAGKIAIHMGGVTQLLFGIKGRRWEVEYKGEYPEMMKNENWIYPLPEETPEKFKTIEDGCYW